MNIFLDTDNGIKEFAFELAKKINCDLPVIVCVGSDRVVSDMIGPLTAEVLVNKYKVNAYVYGRIKNPIFCKNLKSAFKYIKDNHDGNQIIIIDATLGKLCNIGQVKLINGGCVPAGAFGISEVVYGDISILPVVSTFGIDEKTFLSCAKFNEVYALAKNLAKGISKALQIFEFYKEQVC